MYAEFVGKYLVRSFYHCRYLGMIILARKHIEIDYIYGYGLFQLAVILAAFQLRRIQLCPIEKRSVPIIRIVFHLYLHIYKTAIYVQAQVKSAELPVIIIGRKLGISDLYLLYAFLRNIKHSCHKGMKHILIIGKKLLEYYIKLCRNHIACHIIPSLYSLTTVYHIFSGFATDYTFLFRKCQCLSFF